MYNKANNRVLVIENTYYSLLLYILSDPYWRTRDYFLVNERISRSFISRMKCLVNSVSEIDCFPRIRFSHPISSCIQRVKFLKIIKDYDVICGNIYELKLSLSHKTRWVQIDDGEYSFSQLMHANRNEVPFEGLRGSFIFRYFFAVDYKFDFENVSYLLPDNSKYQMLKDRFSIEYVDMKYMYQQLSVENKNVLHGLFGLDFDLNAGKYLILMQPLFSDGLVNSIEEEIKLYEYMIDWLALEKHECVFKPHPASKIDYCSFFPNSIFISNDFPSELISLSGKHFEKVVTLYSSGISIFIDTAKEIYFFGSFNLNLPVELLPYKIVDGKKEKLILGE